MSMVHIAPAEARVFNLSGKFNFTVPVAGIEISILAPEYAALQPYIENGTLVQEQEISLATRKIIHVVASDVIVVPELSKSSVTVKIVTSEEVTLNALSIETAASEGQLLYIYNGDTAATTGVVIEPGDVGAFISISSRWVRLNPAPVAP